MTAPNLSRRSLASYDAAGTAIRLRYDPGPGQNLFDDPEFVHELAHYGQNVTSWLGVEQTMMAHEMFAATARVLREAPRLRLPLSVCRNEQRGVPSWESADIPLAFHSNVLGKSRGELLDRYAGVVNELRSNVIAAAYRPGAANPFYVQPQPPEPGFGLRCSDGTRIFFPIDGNFVLEVHARSAAFLARWSHARLNIGEAVEYFLYSQNNPYTLLYLAVSKLLTERLGEERLFDVQDAVLICHLCAQIALDVTDPELADLTVRQLRSGSVIYSYVQPGEVFLLALAAAMDQFIRPGWAIERYFELMAATLTKRGWPSFEALSARTRAWADELADAMAEQSGSPPDRYTAALLAKLHDSSTAISWVLERYRERDLMSFVRAPALMINAGLITGPLVVGPDRLSFITPDGQPALGPVSGSEERVASLIIAFLTEKLWNSVDVTCLDSDPAGPASSIVGCPRTGNCAHAQTSAGRRWVCGNPLWIMAMHRYPGLWARLPELGVTVPTAREH